MKTRAKPWLLQNLRFAYYFLGVVYLALGLVMLGLEALALALGESPWGFLTGAAVGLGLVVSPPGRNSLLGGWRHELSGCPFRSHVRLHHHRGYSAGRF